MVYTVNETLLKTARAVLSKNPKLYWLVGAAGSGKTTLCRALSDKFDIPVYDMDAHIFGSYHRRFRQDRHPVNYAWSTAQNGLAWLLHMSWPVFNAFNKASWAEHLDLLAEDLNDPDPDARLLIDGGISNPSLLVQVLPVHQILCLARPERSSAQIWEANEARRVMKAQIYQLPEADRLWRTFLEFDERIAATMLEECQEHKIRVYARAEHESVAETAEKVAQLLKLVKS